MASITEVGDRLRSLSLPRSSSAEPGYVVCVVVDRELVWSHAQGAGRVGGAPLGVDTKLYAGSIAKQFTACCAALLIEDGALSVDTPIRDVLPELPTDYERVLVRHLVHHTSGVPAYDPAIGIESSIDSSQALSAATRAGPLLFEPGTQFRYSSTGYVLLAHVVSRAADVPFHEIADDRIFAPLGMRRTRFRVEPEDATEADLALGHVTAGDGSPTHAPMAFHVVGDGGLITSASDLARWESVFDDDSPLGTAVAARLRTTDTLHDGSEHFYAWGIAMWSHRGATIQMHDGSAGGYVGKLVRFPEHGMAVIALANHADLDVDRITSDVADAALVNELDWNEPSWAAAIAARRHS